MALSIGRRTTAVTTVVAVVVLSALIVAGPVSAATGWAGPTRIIASFRPYTPSLVVDAEGFSHLAYLQTAESGAEHAGVWYATNRGGSWATEHVAQTDGDLFARPSLAVDASGTAYIAYSLVHCAGCKTNDAVQVWTATNRSGSWVTRRRTDGFSDLAPSLVVRDGRWHIAFARFGSDIPEAGIWYLTNASGVWVSSRVVSTFGRCPLAQFPSLELDDAGHALVAYEAPRALETGCGGSAGLRLASNASGGWARTTVTSDADDFGPSLELDASDRAHLAFNRGGSGSYYTRRTPSWSAPVRVGAGEDPSLALDASGVAHVTFENAGVVYATNGSGSWVRARLTDVGLNLDEGQGMNGPVLALRSNGKPVVVFARSAGPSEDDIGIHQTRRR